MSKPRLSPRVVAAPPPVAPPPGDSLDAFGVEGVAEALAIPEPPGPRRVAEPPALQIIDEAGGLEAFWSEAVPGPASGGAPFVGNDTAPTALDEFGAHHLSAGVEREQLRPFIVIVPQAVPPPADAPPIPPSAELKFHRAALDSPRPIVEAPRISVDDRPVDAEIAVEYHRAEWEPSAATQNLPPPVIAPVVRARYASLALGAIGFVIGAALVVVVLARLDGTFPHDATAVDSVAREQVTPGAVRLPARAPGDETATSGSTPGPAPVAATTTAQGAARAAIPPPAALPTATRTTTEAAPPLGDSQGAPPVRVSPDSPVPAQLDARAPATAPPSPPAQAAEQPRPSEPLPEMIATATPVTRSIVVQPEPEVRPLTPPAGATPQPVTAPPASAAAAGDATPRDAARQAVVVPAPRPSIAEANASSSASPATMAAARAASDEAAIRRALEGYRSAYNQLNAAGARSVWPSVDVATLARAFEQLESQTLEFTSCQIAVTGDNARAVCGGSASFVPKVGRRSPRRDAREWRFTLQRSDERWVIGRMDMR